MGVVGPQNPQDVIEQAAELVGGLVRLPSLA
jgi:hypothetical protein